MKPSPSHPDDIATWLHRQPANARAVDLSVIVPTYNEERRLPPTLVDMIDYLDSRKISYEIIVVDDGSCDRTSEVVKKFERIRSQVHLIRVPKNYGKGHAVRTGVLNANGRRVLFADADGSTPIEEVQRLEAALDRGAHIAIGSRALASENTKVTTSWHRKYLGRAFNLCVNAMILPQVADTQCGFKLFTGPCAKFLFERQQSDGFSFDVEILFIARQAGLKVEEVPINWTNIPGSKVSLVLDALRMFRDIVLYKVRHRAISPQDFEDYSKAAQTEEQATP
ncbi:MAG: glycosyltransferase family 2 protein [Deltaproteobacteria bacterium]|nr:glycosyltransferase family 2 protein [Deltaproteobacteria bacterium]